MTGGAEVAAHYLLDYAERTAGPKHRQGRWAPPLLQGEGRPWSPAVRVFAAERVRRVPRDAVLALLAWADGHPVELLTTVTTPTHILSLQARGTRCVSLLPDSVSPAPHTTGFDFALHDLCHLGKFVCGEHYAEQVGFFATLERAMTSAEWLVLERGFDEQWLLDRDHVAADMNGSAVFLFAALKMKLKMAVRRRLARNEGRDPQNGGPLSENESVAFRDALERFLDAFDFHDPALRAAAIETSTRRDSEAAARRLVELFEQRAWSGRFEARRTPTFDMHACAPQRGSSPSY